MRILATILLALALPATAFANDRGEAKRFFRAGAAAYEAGQYEAASRALERAYELTPLPAIAFSLAQSYRLLYVTDRKTSHLVRAKELYELYLAATPSGGRRHDAVTSLAEIVPQLRDLQGGPAERVEAKKTQLMVTSNVEDAMASIDGAPPLPVPLTVEIEPGTHPVVVTADGYIEEKVDAIAVEGHLIVTEAELRPKPASIRVRSNGSAAVYVDGQLVGETPLGRGVLVPAGSHHVTLIANGSERWDRSMELTRGQEVELDAPMETTAQRYIAWTLIGASVVTLGAGTLTGLSAIGANQRAEQLEIQRNAAGLTAAELDEYDSMRSRRTELRGATAGLFAATAVLGAGGLLLYIFDEPTYVAPQATSLGLSVGGRF